MIIGRTLEALSDTFYITEFETIRQTGFREGFIAINAIYSQIAEVEKPDLDPLEYLEKVEKMGILAINLEIAKTQETIEKTMSDEDKINRKFPSISINLSEIQLRSLHSALQGFVKRTPNESHNPTNLPASAARKVEGGLATRMYKEIERVFPDLAVRPAEKTKVGFGRY